MNNLDAAQKFIDDELELFAQYARCGTFDGRIHGLLAVKQSLAQLNMHASAYTPKPVPEAINKILYVVKH